MKGELGYLPPPFLYADFSAQFSRLITDSPSSWKVLSEEAFVNELLSTLRRLPRSFMSLDSSSKRAVVGAFHPKWQDMEDGELRSSASRSFFEDCLVKLKKEYYGMEEAKMLFDPRGQGAYRDSFNRSAGYIASILRIVERYLAEPYFCHECGIFGERNLLTFSSSSRRWCLGCAERFSFISRRFALLLPKPGVEIATESSRAASDEPHPSSSRATQDKPKEAAHVRSDEKRMELLGIVVQAAMSLGADAKWVPGHEIVRRVMNRFPRRAPSGRSIYRELALHSLDHPERMKYLRRRVGRYLFRHQAPGQYKLLPGVIPKSIAADGNSAFAGISISALGGEFRLVKTGELEIHRVTAELNSEGALRALKDLAHRKLAEGNILVSSGLIYWIQYSGAFSSKLLIGRFQEQDGHLVAVPE